MFNYANEWEALNDVLRLSRGMLRQQLQTGGAVIMGDAKLRKHLN
jgi:leucine dehydrogenase